MIEPGPFVPCDGCGDKFEHLGSNPPSFCPACLEEILRCQEKYEEQHKADGRSLRS